jgi:hypothetical protein
MCSRIPKDVLQLHADSTECLVQVLQGLDGGGKTMHFEALRREVQLASRFNSERLVQVAFCSYLTMASQFSIDDFSSCQG